MIAPTPPDLEVARRKSLLRKTTTSDQGDRRHVAGLNAGLKAMQLARPERIPHNCAQPIAHKAAPLKISKRVVAEIAALKDSQNDIRDVDNADEAVALLLANDEATVRRILHAKLPWLLVTQTATPMATRPPQELAHR